MNLPAKHSIMAGKELMIVGAGVTGSLTAALLSRGSPGLSMTVWDKARGAGGRMTTHRDPSNPASHVDMGAQYVSRFQAPEGDMGYRKLKESIYTELISSGTLSPFFGTIEGEMKDPTNPALCHYVAPKGLSSIAEYFLDQSKAAAHFQHQLTAVNVDNSQRSIQCTTADGAEARCDVLILTMPVPHILALEGNLVTSIVSSEKKLNLESVRYSSRYALGLFYDGDSLPHCHWSAKYFDNPIIRYASWDASKRESAARGKPLLLHTSVPFGIKHLETDRVAVQDLVMETLEELIPGLSKAFHSHIIRWRYSQVSQPYPNSPGCVILSEDPLVVATGDGFSSGSNFESCLQAAQATVNVLSLRRL